MSDEIQFELARPIESHARLVMQWRNDPHTLEMSFHKQPKEWSSFYPEFIHDYFSLADLPPLFALQNGHRVGFLRFRPAEDPIDVNKRSAEISINIAPEHRGKGLGQRILETVQEIAAAQGYDSIYAEIKNENAPSKRAFQAAGFHPLNEKQKMIEDTQEECWIIPFIVDLSPHKVWHSIFIIAEAGSNWRVGTTEKDLEMARKLIDAAVSAGADAVKFQVFRPDSVYVKNAGQSDYLADAGIKQDIHSMFAHLAMPYQMIPQLAAYCQTKGIEFMATPFSLEDFKQIDPYVKRHKIGSYEIGHIRLIEAAARSGKPLFLSTGGATEEEIKWAVDEFHQNGGKELTLLQCTAQYPAEVQAMNLKTIPWMAHRFKKPVGLSDHSRHPTCAPIAAVALGATALEKHFTLDNTLEGPDHAFALTPSELRELVHAVRKTEVMLGTGVKNVHRAEEELRAFAHRGIQAIRDIAPGEALIEGVNIDILRPGKQKKGLHPKYLTKIEGKKTKRAIPLGQGVTLDDL